MVLFPEQKTANVAKNTSELRGTTVRFTTQKHIVHEALTFPDPFVQRQEQIQKLAEVLLGYASHDIDELLRDWNLHFKEFFAPPAGFLGRTGSANQASQRVALFSEHTPTLPPSFVDANEIFNQPQGDIEATVALPPQWHELNFPQQQWPTGIVDSHAFKSGGEALVFRMWNIKLGIPQAVRFVRIENDHSDSIISKREHVDRHQREAKLLASLKDPHFPKIYNAYPVQVGGLSYVCFILEYFPRPEDLHILAREHVQRLIENQQSAVSREPTSRELADAAENILTYRNLQEIWDDGFGLLPHQIQEVISESGTALEILHQQEIAHRDIKPTNILTPLDRHRPSLTIHKPKAAFVDFGMSNKSYSEEHLLRHRTNGGLVGTIEFTPWEGFSELRQETFPEHRAADIFALAATAFYVLFGVSPFAITDLNNEELISYFVGGAVEKMSKKYYKILALGDLLGFFLPVFQRALSPHTDQRYKTATEFATAFSIALEKQRNLLQVGTDMTSEQNDQAFQNWQVRVKRALASHQSEIDPTPIIG